ncbi:MAG: CpaF family protein, partial [Candidatus Wallbacteria bacterium]|nr:CpaF family protein [Candidatus Wallbacteria bacterium]
MRRWLLAELALRLERLVAFEKLDVQAKDLAQEREILGEKLRYCFRDLSKEYRIRTSETVTDGVIETALRDAAGLGPIQPLLDDPEVNEVMVNGPDQIYIEKKGKVTRTGVRFRDAPHVRQIIDRILTRVGRRADDSNPIADARLQDGSRVNVVLAPISLVGPAITIRKFRPVPIQVLDLVGFGSLSPEMAL